MRLAEAQGGLTKKPKKVRATQPPVQVLETSAYDPKGSVCTSTKTKYENQSKHYSISIHIQNTCCGDLAGTPFSEKAETEVGMDGALRDQGRE